MYKRQGTGPGQPAAGGAVLDLCPQTQQVFLPQSGGVLRHHQQDVYKRQSQHSESVSMDQLRADVMEKVIKATIPAELLDENTKYYICLLYTSRCV